MSTPTKLVFNKRTGQYEVAKEISAATALGVVFGICALLAVYGCVFSDPPFKKSTASDPNRSPGTTTVYSRDAAADKILWCQYPDGGFWPTPEAQRGHRYCQR